MAEEETQPILTRPDVTTTVDNQMAATMVAFKPSPSRNFPSSAL